MMLLFSIFYDILISFFLILFFPFLWKKIKPEKDFRYPWKERFGIYQKELIQRLQKNKNIWIHTVSIGEFLSVIPVIEELKKQSNPVISFTTKTGRKVGEERLKAIPIVFFPVDLSFIIRKSLRILNPKLIVIVETEIWPNLIINAYKKKIPVVIINGRISERSFRNYKRFRFILKKILPKISKIIMRTEKEKKMILSLGAKRENVTVCGSIKFDMAYDIKEKINSEEIKKIYKIPENKKIICFGSIHPEEEKGILNIVEKILKDFKDVIFIIVPRFLDRTKIFAYLREMEIEYIRESEFNPEKDFSVIVVDSYGKLNNFYSICDFTFVGGSLNGYGGQNPIEPVAFKKCVICGKDMWYFEEEWEKIKNGKGGIEVKDYKELYEKIVFLLENPEMAKQIGENGYKVLLENRGTVEKTLLQLKEFL